MPDNSSLGSLQVPPDVTDIVKVELRTEALRRFLVELKNTVVNQSKTIAELEKRVKALEDAS